MVEICPVIFPIRSEDSVILPVTLWVESFKTLIFQLGWMKILSWNARH